MIETNVNKTILLIYHAKKIVRWPWKWPSEYWQRYCSCKEWYIKFYLNNNKFIFILPIHIKIWNYLNLFPDKDKIQIEFTLTVKDSQHIFLSRRKKVGKVGIYLKSFTMRTMILLSSVLLMNNCVVVLLSYCCRIVSKESIFWEQHTKKHDIRVMRTWNYTYRVFILQVNRIGPVYFLDR